VIEEGEGLGELGAMERAAVKMGMWRRRWQFWHRVCGTWTLVVILWAVPLWALCEDFRWEALLWDAALLSARKIALFHLATQVCILICPLV
jgi:hypothetical protein